MARSPTSAVRPIFSFETALGRVGLLLDGPGGALAGILLPGCEDWDTQPLTDDPGGGAHLVAPITAYLAGADVALQWDWLGAASDAFTPWRRAVSRACYDIPRGRTRRYGEVAALLGKPGAARAVGQIMATNPYPLLIPCHRVVGADGLHGFGGGLALKARLLALEAAQTPFALRADA